MHQNSNQSYDVAIIGGGLTGLVAASYLVNQKLRVIVIEQASRVGGCCITLIRQQHYFDAGAHVLCSMRSNGIINRVLTELGILSRLKILQIDPTDKVVLPDVSLHFYRNIDQTIEGLSKEFPEETQNILSFFKLIDSGEYSALYLKFRRYTFDQLLNIFFTNLRLKEVLKIFLGNIGLPADEIPAMAGIALYKEYVLDNGYYPEGGIGVLTETLAERIKSLGGEVKCLSKVTHMEIKGDSVKSIHLSTGEEIVPAIVISTISPQYLFGEIIKAHAKTEKIFPKMSDLKPSASVFAVNLALKQIDNSDTRQLIQCPIWYSSKNGMDRHLREINKGNAKYIPDQLYCTSSTLYDSDLAPPGNKTLSIFTNAPYQPMEYWKKNENFFADRLIELTKNIVDLSNYEVIFKIISTPYFYYRYTMNYEGAYKGWASNVDQCDPSIFKQDTLFNNLYQAGHWTTMLAGQGGIPMAFYSGKAISRKISVKLLGAVVNYD